jgi:hypothetical protein
VIKKKNAPLLIKSSAVSTSSSTNKRPRQVRGKEWRVTVRTLSNADLIMICGISSHPRRVAAAATLPMPKAGSKLVLASGINSSTTVTMTPLATTPPRTTTTTSTTEPSPSAVVDTASVYYPADAAYKTVDRVEVQLMRNPFAKHHPLVRGGGPPSNALLERLKIGMYFGVWYALNVIYNSKCL